jgi:hypothetical protein
MKIGHNTYRPLFHGEDIVFELGKEITDEENYSIGGGDVYSDRFFYKTGFHTYINQKDAERELIADDGRVVLKVIMKRITAFGQQVVRGRLPDVAVCKSLIPIEEML